MRRLRRRVPAYSFVADVTLRVKGGGRLKTGQKPAEKHFYQVCLKRPTTNAADKRPALCCGALVLISSSGC